MITLNNVLGLFENIAERHQQIFYYAEEQDFNIGTEEASNYPKLVVNPSTPVLPKGENGYSMLRFSIDLQVIDLLDKDMSNEKDVMSDTMQIITDIVTEFSSHPDYFEQGIDITNDITLESLRGVYDSDATGYKCTLEIEIPLKSSYCTNPVNAKT